MVPANSGPLLVQSEVVEHCARSGLAMTLQPATNEKTPRAPKLATADNHRRDRGTGSVNRIVIFVSNSLPFIPVDRQTLLESIVPMIGLLPKQPPTVTANSVAVADAEHAVRPNDAAGRNGFLRPRVTTNQCYHHPSLSVVCNWFRAISSTSRHVWIRLCPRNFCKITPQVGKTLSLSIHFTKWGVPVGVGWRTPCKAMATARLEGEHLPASASGPARPPGRASLRPLVESTPGTVKCSVNRDKA
jgi:hypothetical protein